MSFNFLKDYSLEIKSEYIKTQLIEDLRLRDTVIVVNFNNSWIVIPLLSLTYYPFLYFYNDETKETITLVTCLVTLRTMFVYDKVFFDSYDGYEIKLSLNNKIYKFDELDTGIKKSQAKIQSLRSALIEYNDVKYLHIDKFFNKPMIKMDYYTNLYDYLVKLGANINEYEWLKNLINESLITKKTDTSDCVSSESENHRQIFADDMLYKKNCGIEILIFISYLLFLMYVKLQYFKSKTQISRVTSCVSTNLS